MYGSRDRNGLGVGALSKSWLVRVITVLVVSVAGAGIGLVWGGSMNALILGLIVGVVLGIGCVVMGESSMDTGAYKYPHKYF